MNFDNFTIKAQEAVNQASKIADGNNQQAVETGHLLKGLMVNAEGVTGFLLKKLGV
jgi:ATP-dependent Clp protease ATP-binding subunit ClpB